jgi:hypothetical protein
MTAGPVFGPGLIGTDESQSNIPVPASWVGAPLVGRIARDYSI